MPEDKDFAELSEEIRAFVAARDWERFHTPKSLLLALVGEVGELAEVFQWLTEAEAGALDGELRTAAEDEIADVFIYLLQLCTVLGVDPAAAIESKMAKNALKYPPPGS